MNVYEEQLKNECEKKLKEYEKNSCKITPDDESLGDSVKRYYNIHGFI